jgi:hypothetical protein
MEGFQWKPCSIVRDNPGRKAMPDEYRELRRAAIVNHSGKSSSVSLPENPVLNKRKEEQTFREIFWEFSTFSVQTSLFDRFLIHVILL